MKCITCHKYITDSYYEDWTHQCSCASHGYPEYCISCNKFLIPGHRHMLSCDKWICDSCFSDVVTEKSLDKHLDWVLNLLYNLGFQDIQRDWVKFQIVKDEDINSENALGVHFDNGSVRSNRGRYGFDQTIQIVDYLNQIEFCQVLAHELLHAWQIQNDLEDYATYHTDEISMKVCEGFAQMGSFYIYDYIERHSFDDNVKRYTLSHKASMLRSSDPTYGAAFKVIYDHFMTLRSPKWHYLIKEARKSELRKLFNEKK